MDGGIFPIVCFNTPRLMPCLSWTYNLKGSFKSDNSKLGLRLTLCLLFQRLFETYFSPSKGLKIMSL